MPIALSVPGISVNNIPIAIVPNSFVFKNGDGTTTVRAASIGGGSVEPIHTENAEEKVGMMKWEMYVTDDTISLVREWKSAIGLNAIVAQQPNKSPISMGQASMVNDPDFEAGADTTVEIEFQGAPIAGIV